MAGVASKGMRGGWWLKPSIEIAIDTAARRIAIVRYSSSLMEPPWPWGRRVLWTADRRYGAGGAAIVVGPGAHVLIARIESWRCT